jgi:hypothetical protein
MHRSVQVNASNRAFGASVLRLGHRFEPNNTKACLAGLDVADPIISEIYFPTIFLLARLENLARW